MSTDAPLAPWRRACRWGELFVLYFLVPGLLAAAVDPAERFHPAMRGLGLGWLVEIATVPRRLIFPVLLSTMTLVVFVLMLDRSFDRSNLWAWRRARPELPRILAFFGINALLLLGLTAYLAFATTQMPEGSFLGLPRHRPALLAVIWLAYPWFSAYPQEVTHRVFFWRRYEALMPRTALIAVNAVAFAWMHALFWNWIALAITFVGGLLFAWTYDRTRSGLAAGIEHALYGNWCFTIGLGWFVFTGSIGT